VINEPLEPARGREDRPHGSRFLAALSPCAILVLNEMGLEYARLFTDRVVRGIARREFGRAEQAGRGPRQRRML
jgi:hypothetical protein